jgi:hypothetical protein
MAITPDAESFGIKIPLPIPKCFRPTQESSISPNTPYSHPFLLLPHFPTYPTYDIPTTYNTTNFLRHFSSPFHFIKSTHLHYTHAYALLPAT